MACSRAALWAPPMHFPDVLLRPGELQYKPWFLHRLHNHLSAAYQFNMKYSPETLEEMPGYVKRDCSVYLEVIPRPCPVYPLIGTTHKNPKSLLHCSALTA